jgi:hypothetical protein
MIDDSSVMLHSMKSRVTLIAIYDPTADISNKTIASYRKLLEKYRDKGFALVAIKYDNAENSLLAEWHYANQSAFSVLKTEKTGNTCSASSFVSFPASLVLNADGKIIFRHMGYQPATMEVEIRELLGLNPFEDLEIAE